MKAIPCVVESKWSRRLFSALRVKPDRSSYVARAVHIVIAIKFGACPPPALREHPFHHLQR